MSYNTTTKRLTAPVSITDLKTITGSTSNSLKQIMIDGVANGTINPYAK